VHALISNAGRLLLKCRWTLAKLIALLLLVVVVVVLIQVLECPTEASLKDTEGPDLAGQLAAFGRRYVTTDSITALQYYMLAAAVSGNDFQDQGRLFRELLVQSRDYGKRVWLTCTQRPRLQHAAPVVAVME
jgi:hypothetical protein